MVVEAEIFICGLGFGLFWGSGSGLRVKLLLGLYCEKGSRFNV